MYYDYEEEEQNANLYTSVVTLPKIVSKKKETETNSKDENNNKSNLLFKTTTTTTTTAVNSNANLPESSNPTPEEGKSKVSSPLHNSTISNSTINHNTSKNDSFDDILGFLSGGPTTTSTTSTTSNGYYYDTVDENDNENENDKDKVQNKDNNNNNIDKEVAKEVKDNEIIPIDDIEVKFEKEEIKFHDEFMWDKNKEDSKVFDEFLKNRIIDSFKNNTLKPREHQWKTILSVLKDVIKPQYNNSFKSGNRYNYLIQHAAGSGKSLTIAMLVYFLYKIEVNNRLKFDTIVIMNDRTQLDAQLGDVIIKFLKSNGITNFCRPKSSKELQREITMGKNRIIITTMQKFSQLLPTPKSNATHKSMEDDFAFKYNNVAIISDEAHRSHGKSTTEKLHNFLNGNTKQPGLITYFSFTCTPTIQCLEMFGIARLGNRVPFHTYSMEDAQKDKLVLDVMSNIKYPFSSGSGINSYVDAYNLASQDDSFLCEDEKDLKRKNLDEDYVDGEKILEKSKFIVKHIIENKKILDKNQFKCRAMLVCSGRRNLLTYKKNIDEIISHLPAHEKFDTIAAFSSFQIDGKSILESDPSVNGKYSHYGNDKMRGITKALIDDKNFRIRLILVADKLQTGFDEPSLCLMYIDKKIKGANAVQTLSRLSRIAKDKSTTHIIDFVNNQSEIKQVFNLYKNSTTLRDLQDSPTLNSALQVASKEISVAYVQERNVNSFCKAIVYHEENITELSPKYKNLEYSIEAFLEIYKKILERKGDIPPIAIPYKTVYSIQSTLATLRQEKKKNLYQITNNVKVKIDYLTDEEAKKSEQFNAINVDYDAEFAAKMWAGQDTITKKDPLYEMSKKLDTFTKSNSNTSFNKGFNANGTGTNSDSKLIFDLDPNLDYKNQNYQANFSKPIPNPNDIFKNKNSTPTKTPSVTPFVRKDLWSNAKTLGKRPTMTYPNLSTNLIQPNKRLHVEKNENQNLEE